MSKEYRVEYVDVSNVNGDLVDQIPIIKKEYQAPGVSWRDAKKELRRFYTEKARSFRKVKEKDYFSNE